MERQHFHGAHVFGRLSYQQKQGSERLCISIPTLRRWADDYLNVTSEWGEARSPSPDNQRAGSRLISSGLLSLRHIFRRLHATVGERLG
ncbi:hypothetical protein F2P81_008186 [Scophthalmus maximus]|uniref:Uncharacterized protein n=1 Tax=Scophthalmus maximus TaxID=52904 RepID=A0A6A4RSM1_SCOMX|nr:hypothetical protein F2P81_025725 [Scophthalmus maximus]KAF0039951.1 hypothetical protein F2P81_008186 [Scophthalmus maximus]